MYIPLKFLGCIKFGRACIMSPEMIDKYPWEWPSIPHPPSRYYPTYFTPTQNPHKIITYNQYTVCGWLGLANTPGSRLYKVACNTHPVLRTMWRGLRITIKMWLGANASADTCICVSVASQNGDCTNLARCLFC